MRALQEYPVNGRNSLWNWTKIQNPLKVALNFITVYVCGFLPSLRIKNVLYRSLGIQIAENAAVGVEVMFDPFFPELIEIGDNTVIGYGSTILCHEFLVDRWNKGPVKIGKNVLIGANCTILAGVTVADNATISACSLVNSDVPYGAFVGGIPAKEIASDIDG